MTLIAKSEPKRNFCKAHFAVLQQRLGFLNPPLQDLLVGRYSHILLKQAQKVIGADLGDRAQLD